MSVTTSLMRRREGLVATVTISNPARMNSLNSTLLCGFIDTMSSLAKNPDLRCVVITGGPCAKGPVFSAGADLAELSTFTDSATARAFINKLHLAIESIRLMPVPVISRVNGHALGGGMILMMGADLRVATSQALFGMPEVRRGVPSTVESALIPSAIGVNRARRLLLLGDNISAQEAELWGLVDKVVPADHLDNAVQQWIDALLNNPPSAMRAQKELMLLWEQQYSREAIRNGIWEFGRAFESSDTEGPTKIAGFKNSDKLKNSKL